MQRRSIVHQFSNSGEVTSIMPICLVGLPHLGTLFWHRYCTSGPRCRAPAPCVSIDIWYKIGNYFVIWFKNHKASINPCNR